MLNTNTEVPNVVLPKVNVFKCWNICFNYTWIFVFMLFVSGTCILCICVVILNYVPLPLSSLDCTCNIAVDQTIILDFPEQLLKVSTAKFLSNLNQAGTRPGWEYCKLVLVIWFAVNHWLSDLYFCLDSEGTPGLDFW